MESNKQIFCRADGNARIGAGHLMRLMSITDSVKERVTYLCAEKESSLLPEKRGYKTIVLQTPYNKMEEEIPLFPDIFISPRENNLILVDSYYVTKHYLAVLSTFGRVVLLDDFGTEVFPVEGILNYNVFADRTWYEKMYPGKKCFVGPAYLPLREQFCKETGAKKERKGILLTTGGGDKDNIAGEILKLILKPDREIHVVAGSFSPNIEQLRKFSEGKENIVLHCDVKNMAELMNSCRLGITAGGTTVYEMWATGLPFVCFSYAENQEKLEEYVGMGQLGFAAGKYHREPAKVLKKIKEYVEQAENNEELCISMAQKGKKLVDGKGALRLYKELLEGVL